MPTRSPRGELLRQPGDERRLARAADREIADDDDRFADPLRAEPARGVCTRGAARTTAP